MAEAAQQTQHEFWRPPIQTTVEPVVHSELVEACDRCTTEFIVGSRYCHACGARRPGSASLARTFAGSALAEFGGIAQRLGLPVPAFIAFIAGVGCLIGALGVGIIFSARTVLDWQAVQLWRIEWLLGAVAMFVAGCVLKRSSSH